MVRASTGLARHVESVRHFNRFYTQQLGLLDEEFLQSPLSLPQVRVLYELAHRNPATATEICQALGFDRGYVSRMLRFFGRAGLTIKRASKTDARQKLLRLTPKGRATFARLNRRANQQIAEHLSPLSLAGQQNLVEAMLTIEQVLRGTTAQASAAPPPYVLRRHRPGDMGWVVHRHGAIYSREYGWDERFEALVAAVVAQFIQQFDGKRERCFIAERQGEVIGSVFLMKKSRTVAQLRLLLVEPNARGLGLGKRLVEECSRFARRAGYRKITLWTNSVLHAAGHIYENLGYRLVHRAPHNYFGEGLVGETWELRL